MFASVKVWPTSTHSFIPIIVVATPFKKIDTLDVLDKQSVEECVNCHRPLDKFSRDGDKFRCCWCQRQIKPVNIENAGTQCTLKRFLIRERTEIEGRFNLVFALDLCAGSQYLNSCVRNLITAIGALPDDQPFHLSVIQRNYITWVFVNETSVVLFDTAHEPNISRHLNLKVYTNYKRHLNIIRPYLESLKCETRIDEDHGIDSLIDQLVGENSLFSRIVLFGPRAPKRRETKMLFVDWISPIDFSGAATFDGLFLSEQTVGASNMELQIKRMMHEIAIWKPIFNIEITAHLTGYKIVRQKYEYAGGLRCFSQLFSIQPKVTSLGQFSFAVEVKYVRFLDGHLSYETIWMAKSFPRSSDFIPICMSIRPWVLISLLAPDRLDKFLKDLISHYSQYCTSTLAGKPGELTFSTVPRCQRFLSYAYRRDILSGTQTTTFPRVFCDMKHYFGEFYPRLSLWADFDTCVARNCFHDKTFYRLMGEPPIIVMDKVHEIVIFEREMTNEPIPDSCALGGFLAFLFSERFPEPVIIRASLKDVDIAGVFDDKAELAEFLRAKFTS